MIPEEKRKALLGCIAEDPRPSYQDDSERVYGMRFAEFDIRFTVQGSVAEVVDVQTIS